MREDKHTEDEFFRKAYRDFREHPSAQLREKILAQMKDNNTNYQRQKMISAQQIAFVVLLLLSGIGFPGLLNNTNHSVSQTAYEKNYKPYHPDPSFDKGVYRKDNISQLQQVHQRAKTSVSDNKNQALILHEGKAYYINHYYYHLHTKASVNRAKPDPKPVQNSSLSFPKAKDNPDFYSDMKLISHYQNQLSLSFPTMDKFETDSITLKGKNADAAIAITTLTGNPPDLIANQQQLAERENNLSPANIGLPVVRPHLPRHKWELTPFASLDFTQYHLDNDDTFNGNLQEDKQDIAKKERHELSFSAGLLARWQSDKKFAFKTGVLYSNVIIGIQPQTLYATTDANQTTSYKLLTSSGYAYVKPVFGASPAAGDSITSDHGLHHLHYASLPLLLSYSLLNAKRISLVTSTGVITSFLLSTKIETDVNDHTNKEALVINKLIGLRPLYVSFMADLELQYHINGHIGITFNPMMKYAFTSATKNYVVKTFPYSVSAGGGICYAF